MFASFTAFLTSEAEYLLQVWPSRQPWALVLFFPSAFRELYGVRRELLIHVRPVVSPQLLQVVLERPDNLQYFRRITISNLKTKLNFLILFEVNLFVNAKIANCAGRKTLEEQLET